MRTLERDLRSRALHETPLPIALDAASMPGARVLGDDGIVYEAVRWPNANSPYSWQSAAQVAETVAADVVRVLSIETKVTVNRTIAEEVGVNYHTLNGALAYCSQFINDHAADQVESKKLWIEIASGWTAREQIFLEGVDLSNVTLTAVDLEVTVEADYLTRATGDEGGGTFIVHDFMTATRSNAPNIHGVLFKPNAATVPQDAGKVAEVGAYTPRTRGLLLDVGAVVIDYRRRDFDDTAITPRPGGFIEWDYNVRIGQTGNLSMQGGFLDDATVYGLRNEGSAVLVGSAIRGCGEHSITNRGRLLITADGQGLGAVFAGVYTQDYRTTPGSDTSADIEVINGGQVRINGSDVRGGLSVVPNTVTRDGFASDTRAPNATINRPDLIGTVSQSGGEATGEVIERGSGPNGEYVRFADGTQICTRSVDMGDITANGAGTFTTPYSTNAVTAGFAATFVAAPVVSFGFPTPPTGGVPGRMLLPAGYDVNTTGLSNFRVGRASGESTASIVTATVTAIGRWF